MHDLPFISPSPNADPSLLICGRTRGLAQIQALNLPISSVDRTRKADNEALKAVAEDFDVIT